jgi:hypothetical protein
MHPHHHHHHHQHHHHHHHQQQQQQRQQQAMFAQQQQQQQANMLFYQYNQLQSMHSNPALTSGRFMQQPMEQQQGYRPDQLVPQTSPQVTTPVQQQQLQRSSPITMVSISSPKAWMNGSTLQNPEVFLPIIRTVSNTKLDSIPYAVASNIGGSSTSTPTMAMLFESPKLSRHHHSKRQSSTDHHHHHRRQRLHSGSSCYESDSPDISSNDEDEFGVNKNRIYS